MIQTGSTDGRCKQLPVYLSGSGIVNFTLEEQQKSNQDCLRQLAMVLAPKLGSFDESFFTTAV